jgi:hypothetical protein
MLSNDKRRLALLAQITQLRIFLNFNTQGSDLNHLVNEVVAQNAVCSAIDYLRKLLLKVVNSAFKSVTDFITYAHNQVSEIFNNFLTSAFGTMASFIKNLLTAALSYVYSAFESRLPGLTLAEGKKKQIIVGAYIIAIMLIFKGVNLLTDTMLYSVLAMVKSCFVVPMMEVDVVAQSPEEPVSFITNIFNVVFSWSDSCLDRMLPIIRRCQDLMVTGNIIKKLSLLCLCLFPTVLSNSIIYTFGSTEDALNLDIENWRSEALVLLSVSRIQKVVCSDTFNTMLKDLLNRGNKFVPKIKTSTKIGLRNSFFGAYSKLINLYTNYVALSNKGKGRIETFCFHIAGEGGIGKTSASKTIFRRLGFEEKEIYPMPSNIDYQDGMINPRAVWWDEFMVTSDEPSKEQQRKFFFDLISSESLAPNYASVDDPNVGIKGNTVEPELAITASNTIHEMMEHKVQNSFDRRKRFVLHFKRAACTPLKKGFITQPNSNSLDLTQYTALERADRIWMEVDIYPGGANGPSVPYITGLTFNEALDYVEEQFSRYMILAKEVRADMNGDLAENVTPEEIIQTVMREAFNIPDKPINIFEYASQAISSFKIRTNESYSNLREYLLDQFYYYKSLVPTSLDIKLSEKLSMNYYCNGPSEFKMRHLFLEKFCGNGSYSKLVGETLRNLVMPVAQGPSVINLALGTATILAIVSMFRRVSPGSDNDDEELLLHSQSERATKVSVRQLRRPRGIRSMKSRPTSQGPTIPVCILEVNGACHNAIPVGKRWFLTYLHGLPREFDALDAVFHYKDKHIPVVIDADNVRPVDLVDEDGEIVERTLFSKKVPADRDICFIHIPNNKISEFPDIRKHFISEDELKYVPKSRVVFKDNHTAEIFEDNNNAYVLDDLTMKRFPAFRYYIKTESGDCGLPVKICSGPLINKIVGIHVAGTPNAKETPFAICSPITQEEIRFYTAPTVCAQGPSQALSETLIEEYYEPELDLSHATLSEPIDIISGPNHVVSKNLPYNSVIHHPSTTKLKKCQLADNLPWECVKTPAILSSSDPRSNGKDPSLASLQRLADVEEFEYNDEGRAQVIFDTMFEKYKDLDPKIGEYRHLTIEEAVFGIPGIFNRLNPKTSPGHPLVHVSTKQGKKSFFGFDEFGNRYLEPMFADLVGIKVKEILSYSGGVIDHRFIQYMKDELVSTKKIIDVRTRAIYANDVIFVAAVRVIFGSVMIAITNNFEITGISMGLNQNSKDMDRIYKFVTKFGPDIIDGDFEAFDMNVEKKYHFLAYMLMGRIAIYHGLCDERAIHYVYRHETKSPVQAGRSIHLFRDGLFSGGVWTSIIGCFINESYNRDCVMVKYPHLEFDENFRLAKLGDDHLLGYDNLKTPYRPDEHGESMKRLGQKYTSAFKDEELGSEPKHFDKVLYLGSHPRIVHGMWTGALRKSTLEQMVSYTRDCDLSLEQKIQQALDFSSQWDYEYFEYYKNSLKDAYEILGKTWAFSDNHASLQFAVLNRSADSGFDFGFPVAQGPGNCVGNRINTNLSYVSSKINVILDTAQDDSRLSELAELYLRRSRLYYKLADVTGDDINKINADDDYKSYEHIIRYLPKAQGASYSSTSVNNTYTISDVTGGLPIQNTVSTENKPQIDGKMNMTLPMDNPPMASGALPMVPQFSGMSKSNGIEITNEMEYHPLAMYRESDKYRDQQETLVNTILGKRGFIAGLSWTTSDAEGAQLTAINLNSLLTPVTGYNPATATKIPPNIALLNQYLRWRGDIEIDVFCVRTMFHSGRILATLGYGAPSIAAGEENIYNNQVLEFSGENDWCTIKIPYNAATEYLRTYENITSDSIQDQSLGILKLSVANQLKASSSVVSAGVVLLLFVRFSNVKVFGTKTTPTCYVYSSDVPKVVAQGPIPKSQGPVKGLTNIVSTQETAESSETAAYSGLASKAINESELDLKYGLNSWVKRTSITWSNTDATDATLASYECPWGLLALGNQNNLQNMPFNNFIYYVTDIDILLQVTGTPTQAGALIAYFTPLNSTKPDYYNIPSLNHVVLTPNNNSTSVLSIPFRYYRSAMNTFASATESLGVFRLGVYSPLVTGTTPTSCSVTIYTRYRAKFSLPRPIADEVSRAAFKRESEIAAKRNIIDPRVDVKTLKVNEQAINAEHERATRANLPVAQGPEQVIELEEQKGTANEGVTISNTEEESNSRVIAPCKIEPHSKFEYTHADIHEWGRRHSLITPFGISLESGYTANGATLGSYSWNFEAIPRHFLCAFFSCWSGQLKYRVFMRSTSTNTTPMSCTIAYVPAPLKGYQNQTANEYSSAFFNEESETYSAGSQVSPWDAGNDIVRSNGANWTYSIEKMFPLNRENAYLDISIPFSSHYNMLPNYHVNTYSDDAIYSNGRVHVSIPPLNSTSIKTYQAFGDDFRLQVYAPVQTFYTQCYDTSAATSVGAGYIIGTTVLS